MTHAAADAVLDAALERLRRALAGYAAARDLRPAALERLRGLAAAWVDYAGEAPERVHDYCAALAEKEPEAGLVLASALFDAVKDGRYFTLAVRACRARRGTAAQRFECFIRLNYLLIMNKAAFSDAAYFACRMTQLLPLYTEIFGALALPPLVLPPAPKRRALVLVSHLNNPRVLAFAWDALEFAQALRDDYGYEVMLLNCNFWVRGMDWPVWPLQQFSAWTGPLRGVWPHRGGGIPYAVLPENQPTPENMDAAEAVMRDFNPALAIAVGDSNPYADWLAAARPTAVLHFTVDYPLVLRGMAGVHGGLPETDEALLRQAPSGRRIMLSPRHYSLPGRCYAYPRALLGLAADDRVGLVIGHRLDSEVTEGFLGALQAACAAAPRLRIVFAGHFTQFTARLAAYPLLRERSRFIGLVADVAGLCAAGDFFLNPERTGGGSSAVYALAAGLPVLSLPRGDVAFVIGHNRTAADWEAFARRLATLALDEAAAGRARQEAVARAAYLCDRKAQIGTVLEQML